MTEAGHILLIRLKSIGDILFTLPAVHRLRANFPGGSLSFLTSKENAPILCGFAEVDETIILDRALFHQWRLKALCAHTLELLRRLRRGRFSLVVDFQGYGETALLTRLTGAPERWGSVYRAGRAWAYTKGPVRDECLHPADWNLALLERCGLRPTPMRNEFVLPGSALDAARAFLAEVRCDPATPTLFIQPLTSSPLKDWPLANHLALAKHWQSRGMQIIFGGGPAEAGLLEPVRAAGFPVAAGVPLLTAAGLAWFSKLVVGSDTGLLHLAVAMGRRVLMLIHSTSPGSTSPYRRPEWALTPKPAQLVASIGVEAVLDATARALAEEGVTLAAHAIASR